MKKATPKDTSNNEAFEKFQELTRKLIAVPKREIEREAAKCERKKEKAKQK